MFLLISKHWYDVIRENNLFISKWVFLTYGGPNINVKKQQYAII